MYVQNSFSYPRTKIKKKKSYLFNDKVLRVVKAPCIQNSFYYNIIDINKREELAFSLDCKIFLYDY